MIDCETYCKIRDHRDRQGLTITQTSRALGLHPETLSKWSRRERYEPRAPVKRGSQLDPYKGQIIRCLEAHPLSAQQELGRRKEPIASNRTRSGEAALYEVRRVAT